MRKGKRFTASRLILVPAAFVAGMAVSWTLLYLGGFNPSLVPIASAAVGLVVAFGVPLWQAFYLNTPNLTVEISSIRRTISGSAPITIQDDPELQILRGPRRAEWRQSRWGGLPPPPGGPPVDTLEDLDQRLDFVRQRLRDLPAVIEDRKKELERVRTLNRDTITKYEVDMLNRPLVPEVGFDQDDLAGVIRGLTQAYGRMLEGEEKEFSNLQSKLPVAERKLEIVRKDLVNNRSVFTVSVSLINSGRSNTAIKVPGLLRVLIGQGNYIDIKLSLNDFEHKSEIPANGTRIAIFQSPELSSLPEEDRSLINTYWGQSVRAWLLVEDIHGSIARSNYIAFAEGLYQKIIYDRLARAAGGFS